MPYPPILRDQNGDPIPIVWDGQNWKPYRGNMPLVTIHQNAATANGNGVAADVDGYGSATFQVAGTFNAKVSFEGSVDGATYVPIFVLDSAGNRVASATAPGIFRADIAGLKSIRTPVSSYVSGAVTVVSRALPVARPVDQSVQINGRKASRVQNVLTTTPLAAYGTYTQPWIDAESWVGASGTGAIVVSGVAKADKPGSLYLEVSHDANTPIIWDAALANSTGIARLKPVTLPLKYFRFRYANGDQAQTSFVLAQNIMQEGDGGGSPYGVGFDTITYQDTVPAGAQVVPVAWRSALELISLVCIMDTPNKVFLRPAGYDDTGASKSLSYISPDGTITPNYIPDNLKNALAVPDFVTGTVGTTWHTIKTTARIIFPRGLQITLQNVDTVGHVVRLSVSARLL